jgi:hypothetical protein
VASVAVNVSNNGAFLHQKLTWGDGTVIGAYLRDVSTMTPAEQERAQAGPGYYSGPVESYDEVLADGTRRALTAGAVFVDKGSAISPRQPLAIDGEAEEVWEPPIAGAPEIESVVEVTAGLAIGGVDEFEGELD